LSISTKWGHWPLSRVVVRGGEEAARRSDRYHRSQTIQLWRHLRPTPAKPSACLVRTRLARQCWRFCKGAVLPHFGGCGKIYLVWDNFSAHQWARSLWLSAAPNIQFYCTPTDASWLNLIEPWFLVLEKTALYNTDLKTTDAIAENLKQGIDYLNSHPRPYRWAKVI
jgi:hypothetical protein